MNESQPRAGFYQGSISKASIELVLIQQHVASRSLYLKRMRDTAAAAATLFPLHFYFLFFGPAVHTAPIRRDGSTENSARPKRLTHERKLDPESTNTPVTLTCS